MAVKKYFSFFTLLGLTLNLSAQNKGSILENSLLWILPVFGVVLAGFVYFGIRKRAGKPLISRQKILIEIEKDRLYYPDELMLTIKNTGNVDVDIDRPWLYFDNFWVKRKFRLNGIGGRTIYPLYLIKGSTHTLYIDLPHFYIYDKRLKRFPKVIVAIRSVKDRRLGSASTFLRKTLFKY